MATVYLADDLRHDRSVALKVLRPELAAVVGVERFLAEIKTTASLQHPHILPLFDSGRADSFVFYVMPYVDEESLSEKLERVHQLPVDEAVGIAIAVASAIQAAHDQGIVHRDIKPQNILLSRGDPLVADFGIALAAGVVGEGRMTETGVSMGTPYYMSPEQATGERTVDGRADVYSLSCVLYEMLTGEPPFQGSTVQAVLGRIITGGLTPPSELRPSVPPNVEAAITKGLEKLPADRFQSARDLGEALADPSFTHSGQDTEGSVAGPRPHAWIRDARSQAAVAAAVVMTALAWVGLPSRETVPEPVSFQLLAPTNAMFVESTPAVSPDGRSIAYIAQGMDGISRIYRRELSEAEPAVVPGTESATTVLFSPDGGWLVFRRRGVGLTKIPVEGGVATTLTELMNTFGPAAGGWTSDGRVLHQFQDHLWVIPAEGGTLEPLSPSELNGERYVVTGVLPLPDASAAVVDYRQDGRPPSLAIVDLTTGDMNPLLDEARAVGVVADHLVYARSDGVVAAVPFDQGRRELVGSPVTLPLDVGTPARARWRATEAALVFFEGGESLSELRLVDRTGFESVVEGAPLKDWLFPRFSPDGRRIASEIHERGGHVWVYDLNAATLTRLTSEGHNTRPAWSPDGSRLAYWRLGLARGREGDLFTRSSDVATPEFAVAASQGRSGTMDWLGADRLLVNFDGDVWAMPMGGDTALTPLVATAANEYAAVASADGAWIAYVSDESGSPQVYVRAANGTGPAYTVSTDGGIAPVWAPHGTELFYVAPDGLVAARLRFDPEFALDRDVLFDLPGFGELGSDPSYAVHPDGERFLFTRPSGQESLRIRVIANFGVQLRRWLAEAGGE